jgi:hypothetical protein
MSNPIVDAVVDANNEAVAMLRNGDHDLALASFRCALDAYRRSPARPFFNSDDQGGTEETNNSIVSVALGDYGLAESQSATPDNLFAFYNHAFVFRSVPGITPRTSQQESHRDAMLPTVFLFNTAMTLYVRALCGGGPNSSNNYLTKALQFYSMTISSMTVQACFKDLRAIELASWNNMGYIYSHFSEHENARRCRVYLCQTLFADPDISLRLTCGYSYALFYLFVVGSEVRRREISGYLSSGMVAER